jgi:peptide/nickel transport system substrate-binding protein
VQERLGGAVNAVRTSQLWPRALPGGPDDPDPRPDLAAARESLAACGQPDGFSTVMAVPDVPSSVEVGQDIADQLAEVGIEVVVRPLDPGSFYVSDAGNPDNVLANGYGLVLATWTADLPTPAAFLVPLVDGRSIRATGNTNYARLNDANITALIDQARATADATEARSLWRDVAAAARESRVYVPLAETRVQLISGQRLHNGLVMLPYSGYDLATAGVR